jgi:hypothetical protein
MSNFTWPTWNTKAERLAYFKAELSTNQTWALRTLEIIFQYQTESEKQADVTVEDNGVGFSGVDAEILSSFAKQAAAFQKKKAAGSVPPSWKPLSPKQLAILMKRMKKYAGQLIAHLEKTGVLEPWGQKEPAQVAA